VRRVLSAVNVRGPIHSEGPNSYLAAGLILSHKLIRLVHLLAFSCHLTTIYQLVSLPS
jgi:hypothetical protein